MSAQLLPGPDESLDSIGPVRILQRRAGYRFTLDALLLAEFALQPLLTPGSVEVVELCPSFASDAEWDRLASSILQRASLQESRRGEFPLGELKPSPTATAEFQHPTAGGPNAGPRKSEQQINFPENQYARPPLSAPSPLTVLDLGAGSGVVGIVVAKSLPQTELTLVEIQPKLAELAARNLKLNAVANGQVIQGDLRTLISGGSPETCRQIGFGEGAECNNQNGAGHQSLKSRIPEKHWELILSNPPWYPLGHFRLNPNSEKAIARHEVRCAFSDIVDAASLLLSPRGRLAVILPVWRLAEGLKSLSSRSLHLQRLRLVCSTPSREPRAVLLEAGRLEAEALIEESLLAG